MKTITSIVLTLTSLGVSGQNGENRLTEDSLRIGEWVFFNEAGKIKIKEFYQIENQRISPGEAFFEGIDLSLDPIRRHERVLWEEFYQYSDDGEVVQITRYEVGKKTTHYFGEHKDLRLLKFDGILLNRAGAIDTIALEFEKSNSCEFIDFTLTSTNKDTFTERFDAEGLQINCSTPVKIESGFTEYYLSIYCDKTKVLFTARALGYDLTTADFQTPGLISLKSEFYFFRTGNETLLKVYKKKTSEPVSVISIGQDKKAIDLEELKNGKYWFCIVDFSARKEYWKRVMIEN